MPAKRELRDLLLDAIEQVKDGTLEPDKAAAVADLSQAVINADRFQLEAMEFAAEHGTPMATISQGRPLAITHEEDEAEPEEDDEEIDDDDEEDDGQNEEAEEAEEEDIDEEPPPPKHSNITTVRQLLKTNQPLDLKEIARRTKIPQAELFRILSDEKLFERESDGFYWLRK